MNIQPSRGESLKNYDLILLGLRMGWDARLGFNNTGERNSDQYGLQPCITRLKKKLKLGPLSMSMTRSMSMRLCPQMGPTDYQDCILQWCE